MKIYRLVNSEYDPIEIGATLNRTSDHSNQKLGEGIYCSPSRDEALRFAQIRHKHTYTHLLTCRLEGIEEDDFVDLVKQPNLLNGAEFSRLNYSERGPAYAKKHGKKGMIWASRDWTEVCLFAEYVPGAVIIEAVEPLPPPSTSESDLTASS